MKYVVDHDYHIHSLLSPCSNDPEQTNERILQYAKENGFKQICIADHHWDEDVPGDEIWVGQGYDKISRALPLPQAENIKFLFGCEADMKYDYQIGLAPEHYNRFDFVIIALTHLHFTGYAITEELSKTIEGRVETWIKKFEALLSMDLPFHKMGIAHLASGLIGQTREQTFEILRMIPEEKLMELFTKAASLGVGIELNACDMLFNDQQADAVLRIFESAKKAGCKFYLGSDAHHPKDLLEAKKLFEKAVDCLSLTEEDKYHIPNHF